MDLREKLKTLYSTFERQGELLYFGLPPEQESRVHISQLAFVSRNNRFLLAVDHRVDSNLSFAFPFFLPGSQPYDECLVLGHGFNEAAYIKLFPWAYCLCKEMCIPVVIFPLAFHMNRRPASWKTMMRPAYRARMHVVGNRCFSPFNAVVSQRISEAPERFFRGALQSYWDVMDLISEIGQGELEVPYGGKTIRPFRRGAKIHFLGYSISGYLYLAFLLIHAQGLLDDSRCLLFSSCTLWEDMDPVSVLVIDREAYEKATDFYMGGYQKEASPEFLEWFLETEIGVWFRTLFLDHSSLKSLKMEVQKLQGRLLIIADPNDPVFSAASIVNHLGEGTPILSLELGRHEFPFNIVRLDGRSFRDIAFDIRESYAPSSAYWSEFTIWLQWVKDFFGPPHERRRANPYPDWSVRRSGR